VSFSQSSFLKPYLAYDKDISPISAKQFKPWLHLKTRLKLRQRFFAQRSLLDEPSIHFRRKKEIIRAPSLYEKDFVYYNPTFKRLRSKKKKSIAKILNQVEQ